jgi:small subunit ribosomal protein S2
MSYKVSLKELLNVGAHFGHQSRRWNPKMDNYLHGIQDGVHVFDLVKTKEKLEEALEFIKESSSQNKSIVLLGTKKQIKERIKEVAQNTNCFWVTERWLGGTITNFDQIKKSIKKLNDMKEKFAEGEYKELTKKEQSIKEREIARLERFFGGLVGLEDVPDVLFIIDSKRESAAVKEANMKEVSTVAIVDSNSDPTLIDYPIPMNDDATKALNYVVDLIEKALLKGKSESEKKHKSEKKTKDGEK